MFIIWLVLDAPALSLSLFVSCTDPLVLLSLSARGLFARLTRPLTPPLRVSSTTHQYIFASWCLALKIALRQNRGKLTTCAAVGVIVVVEVCPGVRDRLTWLSVIKGQCRFWWWWLSLLLCTHTRNNSTSSTTRHKMMMSYYYY